MIYFVISIACIVFAQNSNASGSRLGLWPYPINLAGYQYPVEYPERCFGWADTARLLSAQNIAPKLATLSGTAVEQCRTHLDTLEAEKGRLYNLGTQLEAAQQAGDSRTATALQQQFNANKANYCALTRKVLFECLPDIVAKAPSA